MTEPTSGTAMFQGDVVRLAFGALFTLLLLMACLTDVRSRRIPNALVVLLVVSGIAFCATVGDGWTGVWRSLGGLGLGFAIWIAFYIVGVLGAGDVKLAAAAGAWLGAGGVWRASLLAAVAGGVLAIGMLVRERRAGAVLGRIMTMASTRSVALLAATDEGDSAAGAARNRPMPYGVALAIGALAAAWIPGLLA